MNEKEVNLSDSLNKINNSIKTNGTALIGFLLLLIIDGLIYFFTKDTIIYYKYKSIFNLALSFPASVIIFFIIHCLFQIVKFGNRKRKEINIIRKLKDDKDFIVDVISDIYDKINNLNEKDELINEKINSIKKTQINHK